MEPAISTGAVSHSTSNFEIRRSLERMIVNLWQNRNISVTEVEIGPPTSRFEIETAKKAANGRLPVGVEEFYSQVGSFKVEWETISPELEGANIPATGHINILPISKIFGDNWRDVTWFPLPNDREPTSDDEWRFEYRNVVPFDFFIPEACMCFLQEQGETPDDQVAFHDFEEIFKTRYTFADYIARLLKSYGYCYWMKSLASECEDRVDVEEFRANIPKLFESIDDSLFCP